MQHLASLRIWLHGLGAAVIGGSVTTLGTLPAVNFDPQGIAELKRAAITGAFVGVVAYLKQSPIPGNCDPADAPKQVAK